MVGHFCVEFNLFRNDARAHGVLDKWIAQSLLACSADPDQGSFGDQKYLDGWVEAYDFVVETQHAGAGVAPWNVAQYRLVSRGEDGGYRLKCLGRETDLVFYHFAGIKFLERNLADIDIYSYWGIDDGFVRPLYKDYLQVLAFFRQQIEDRTGRLVLLKSHPAFSVKKESAAGRIRSVLSKMKRKSGRRRLFYIDLPKELFKARNQVRWDS